MRGVCLLVAEGKPYNVCVTFLAWPASGGGFVPVGFTIETCRQAPSMGRA